MPPRGCSRPGWRPWACWGQVAERELKPVTVIDVNDVKGDWYCAVNDVNDVTNAIRWMEKGVCWKTSLVLGLAPDQRVSGKQASRGNEALLEGCIISCGVDRAAGDAVSPCA